MKVCFISSMHPANDKRVHDKEARSLRDAGFDVVHVCPGGEFGADVRSRITDGVRIRQYAAGGGLLGRVRQLRRLYRVAAQENADIYHCNEVDSWFVGAALKLLRKKRCVFDVHEHYPSTFAESRFPRWLQPAVVRIVELVFAALLPFTDRIVLAKSSVGNDFNCADEKKVLVRNFTPLSGLSVAGERPIRRTGMPMTIVHLGLFGKLRGWPEVLRALTMADEHVRLKVIGTINDGTSDEFSATAQGLGLQDRIELLDWMPFERAFGHLLEADVGLIAFQPHVQNHVYAMPHKLFDYMAAGMSVLMPKQAVEVAPIVESTGCGLLIDPSDPVDLARGINELFHHPKKAHEMGKRGQAAVRATYNWEAEAKKLVKMYKGLS